MKKRYARWIVTFVCMVLVLSIVPVSAMAQDIKETERTGTISATYINPIYQDAGSEDSLPAPNAVSAGEDIVYYSTVKEAGEAVREKFKLRQDTITVGLKSTYVDEQQLYDVFSAALAHTGMPDEGDYLRWQFRSWSGTIESYAEDDVYYLTLTYAFVYYTTAEQEEQVDAAIAQLLSELDVTDASDYEKVRAVYDWICENVAYDYANLYDDAYTLKYTAFAALINRTAVCQGYANLFYRLCLELDVDCRIEYGYAFNMFGNAIAHSWNLTRVDGTYYYVDATWGAELDENGEPDYYYLLKSPAGFRDHLKAKDPDFPSLDTGGYCTMAEQDYPIPEKSVILAEGQASDTATWKLTKTGVLTLTGTGPIFSSWNDTVQGWEAYRLNIREVVVEEGITLLGESLFSNSYLSGISLPDSLVTLEDGVFSETSLSTIELPKGLQNLGENAISSSCLQTITVDPENQNFTAVDGVLFTKDGKTLLRYAGMINESDGSLIREYTVPDGTETIGPSAFRGNSILYNVTMPETVKHIGAYAFSTCHHMAINFPESLVSIGEYAFRNCNGLRSIYIGKNVSSIGEGAFAMAYYFYEINVHPENEFYTSVDGVLFNEDMTALIRYPSAKLDSTYEIPYGVTEIASFAFEAWSRTKLTTVAIPNTVVTIGVSGFEGQEKLKCLHLPDSLETIETVAFQGLTNLDLIVIPDGVKTIKHGAFNAHGAETIVIGENVETIAEKAFTRTDYPYQNNNAEIKVYFRGAPPTVPPHLDEYEYPFRILFGYDPEGANSTRVLATVYYPEELTHLWAPNGETEWDPYPPASGNEDYPTDYKIYPGEAPELVYEPVITAPTCTEQGYTTYTCFNCGDSYVDDYVDALGHSYNAAVTVPTCTEQGYTTYTCSVCGDSYVDDYTDPVDHGYEDGKCKWCGEAEYYVDWVSVNTTLTGSIDLNYYVVLSDNLVNADTYVRFTCNGETLDVPMTDAVVSVKDGVTRYRFSYKVFAKEMTDTVTAQVMTPEGAVGEAMPYSVAKYCYGMIGYSKNAEMVALCKAMLNYGTAAQNYFGYKLYDLANASLSEEDRGASDFDASAYAHSVVGSEEGIEVTGTKLLLGADVAIQVSFVLTGDKAIEDYTFTIDGVETVYTSASGGRYYFELGGISASRFDELHTFSVGGLTLNYSVLSYANQAYKVTSASEVLLGLVNAMYAYHAAADAYVN